MERYCEHKMKPCNGRKLVFGLIILVVGVIFLFDNLGVLPYDVKDIIFTWQMLLIAIGIVSLSGRNCFPGIIMILIGSFFLAPHLFDFSFNFTKLFWPVLLIAIGLIMIFRRNIGPHHHFPHSPNAPHPPFTQMDDNMDNLIDEVNVFGGSKRNVISQSFSGGKITCIFGGADLDFTRAKLAEGSNVLDLVCIFGGTSIIIPTDWHVRTEVVSILGGFSDKRQNIPTTTDKDRVLVIKGVAIFGGGEIKSFREL
jgi:predicted membrane protein